MKKCIVIIFALFVYNAMYGQEVQKQNAEKEKNPQTETAKKPVTVSGVSTPVSETSVKPTDSKVNTSPVVSERPVAEKKPSLNIQEIMSIAKPIVEQKENGVVNWTEQYIEATGVSFMDFERFKIEGQAEEMAKRGAIVIAQRNLLEIISGLRITGQTIVRDFVTESDVVMSRIDGVIKGAQMVGEAVVTKNSVKVTMRVPIYDSQRGIAPVIQQNMIEKNPQLSDMMNKNMLQNQDINEEEFPFFALDMKGQTFTPSMFPKIVDGEGNVLIDFATIYNSEIGEFPQFFQIPQLIKDGKYAEAITTIPGLVDKDGNIKINTGHNDKVKNWTKKITNFVGKFGPLLISLI
jgi:hypothetical protein